MEDSVEWCWHGVAVQGKCPFKRPAVKGGVIIEMDQRLVRDLLGLGEDAVAFVARLRILLASDGQPLALAVGFHLAYLLGDGGLILPVLAPVRDAGVGGYPNSPLPSLWWFF